MFRRWFRSNFTNSMRTLRLPIILILSLVLIPVSISAKEKKKPKSKTAKKVYSAKEEVKAPSIVVPTELLAIEKKYVAAKTLEAQFSQHDEVKLTGTTKDSSGVLMIRHPDQFRWETLKPEKNLLVSDGKKFWFYTPPFEEGENGQVLERKTSEVQSELANALLAGAFSKVRGVKITKNSPSKFRLLPNDGVAGSVKVAEIEIDPAKGLIQKLHLEHLGGNKTSVSLTNIKLGGKFADAFFQFVTPPKTDVVRE